MRISTRLLIFFSAVFSCAPLFAQNANVSGQVVDPQHAGINGATVTLTRISTQVREVTKTSQGGIFVLPPVVPGTYKVEAQAQGFSPAVVDGITLEIGESRS